MSASKGRDRSRGGQPSVVPRSHGDPQFGALGGSTIGRPRKLTDRQVKTILAAHARFIAWRALRQTVKSQRQLAHAFGVSQATISLAIRSQGRYKQVSPERRDAQAKMRRETFERLLAKRLG